MSPDGRHRLDDYTAEEIRVSRPYVQHIRDNPGMYIGNVRSSGLHEMLFMLVREALVETSEGFCDSVRLVTNLDGSITISDDGRGFAVIGPPDLEAAFTQVPPWRSPYRFNQLSYITANALSEWLWVETQRNGESHELTFERGEATGVPRATEPTPRSGITVMFLPDPTLFGDERFNPDTIRERLREYAYLNSGVRLSFTNRTTGTEDVYEFSDGIRSYVEWLNVGRQSLNPEVFITRGEAEGVQYEIGVQWCRETDDILERLYVNNLFVPVGGTPLNGLRAAVRVVVNNFILEHLPSEDQVKTNHIREGMTAVVFVRIEDPQFEGAVRGKLINPEAERVLAAGVGEFLRNEFEANPAVAEAIARHAIAAAEAEAKFREARKRKK